MELNLPSIESMDSQCDLTDQQKLEKEEEFTQRMDYILESWITKDF